ncbi:hypothetical protein AB0G04_36465 [Actinoplanes sp. NPDC023801]
MVARIGAMLGSMAIKDATGARVTSVGVISVGGHTMLYMASARPAPPA